ncbi:molybdate ABC transporter permease subunit [Desulfofundulus thermobenzoicus]|uniref:Molybdenum transport system permease n=2 Tax=Desulfofundulus thermobenzoicus TaxID=29376 RepID=A0A6N7IN68_9FIRM|nr:molybdate ABC transporter permease subunit [Desulfofundulus thermobenzoicus]HHW43116.1 molybdate ABC transporter permease subunit [Desulfotomaculum sp.]
MANSLFQGFNIVITVLILVFLGLTLVLVPIRGVPHLWSALDTAEIRFALALSLKTSLISTVLCTLVAVPVAYCLSRYPLPGRPILNVLVNIPLALPPIVSGVCLLMVFGTTPVGHFLTGLGLELIFTVQGIIAAQFFVNLPYMITVMKATMEGVDRRLEFVARTLGCNQWQAFFRVTLPMIRNGLVAALVITWARALGEFGAVLMLAGATRMRTETLPISLYLNLTIGDLDAVMAVATVLMIITTVSLLVFERLGGRRVGRYTGL